MTREKTVHTLERRRLIRAKWLALTPIQCFQRFFINQTKLLARLCRGEWNLVDLSKCNRYIISKSFFIGKKLKRNPLNNETQLLNRTINQNKNNSTERFRFNNDTCLMQSDILNWVCEMGEQQTEKAGITYNPTEHIEVIGLNRFVTAVTFYRNTASMFSLPKTLHR